MVYDPGATAAGGPTFGEDDLGLFGISQAVGEAPITLGYETPSAAALAYGRGPEIPAAIRGGPLAASLGRLGFGLLGPPAPEKRPVSSTVLQASQAFYALPEDHVAELQAKLLAGGFYDDSYYTTTGKAPQFGVADDDSYSAYKRALTRAARSNKALTDILDEAVATKGEGKGPTRQPLVVQLTSPTDLRRVYQAASVALTGSRDMDEGRIASFISSFQASERQSTEAKYAATGSGLPGGPGGTVTEAPTKEAAAEAAVRAGQPTETGGHDIAGQFASFVKIIGGVGSGGGR